MAGIKDMSLYLPRYRVNRESIAGAWGKIASGWRAVANYDEDAITMAADAVSRLEVNSDNTVGLYFASSRPPYQGSSNASVLAQVLGIRPDAFVQDGETSGRGATSALRNAICLLDSGGRGEVLVAAAETWLTRPGSEEELDGSDSAAALKLSRDPGVAEFITGTSYRSDVLDRWRIDGRQFSIGGDGRFTSRYGFEDPCVKAVESILCSSNLSPGDVRWAAVAAPGLKQYRAVLKKIGIGSQQILEKVYAETGNCGLSMPLVLLYRALQSASPGDIIILAGYSGWIDAMLLRVTEDITAFQAKNPVGSFMGGARIDYPEMLKMKRVIPLEELVPSSSQVQYWRERDELLRLSGQKCTVCSSVQFPRRRVCWRCGTRDRFEEYQLARTGQIYTFTIDHLFPSPFGPAIMAVIDLDGGGRIYTQMTDCAGDEVAIGLKVKICLRKYHQGGDFNNYFWKARPIPGAGGVKI
ncbi:MAG: OB-fold domain-containing protein [Bacillota bacterium]